MDKLELVSCNKVFGGLQKVYSHSSSELKCKMNFSIYLPPQAEGGDVKLPLVYYLSGLTCNEQNFITKSGFQRFEKYTYFDNIYYNFLISIIILYQFISILTFTFDKTVICVYVFFYCLFITFYLSDYRGQFIIDWRLKIKNVNFVLTCY